jgi:hypothetical protein
MNTKIFLLLIILFFAQSINHPQTKLLRSFQKQNYSLETTTVKNTEHKYRNLFIGGSIGIFEYLSAHLGYQIDESFSFAIKGSYTWIGSGLYLPNSGAGIGAQINYYDKFLFFNTISLGYLTYTDVTIDKKINSLTKGNFFNISLGNENIDKGIHFLWSLGLCLSAAKESHTIIFPTLNAGLNFNF